MSDEEDLLKLKEKYDAGKISAEEYEQEKAWILGTAAEFVPSVSESLAGETVKASPEEQKEAKEQEQAIIESTLRMVKEEETAEEKTKEAEAEEAAAVITVDEVVKSVATMEPIPEKTEEEKHAEDATAIRVSEQSKKAEEKKAEEPKKEDKTPKQEENAPEKKDKETEKKVRTPEKKEGGSLAAKIVTLICSLPGLNIIGLILALVKKPFSTFVNVLLAMWNVAWTIFIVALITVFLCVAYVQGGIPDTLNAINIKTPFAGITVGEKSADASTADSEEEATAVSSSAAPKTEKATEETSKAEAASSEESATYDEFREYLTAALTEAYDDHYEISDDGEILCISVWQDGVAKEAALAIDGNEEALKSWDSLKSVMQGFSKTLYDNANEGEEERHVQLNVLNDGNTENILLTYVDGVLVYDAVEAAGEQ